MECVVLEVLCLLCLCILHHDVQRIARHVGLIAAVKRGVVEVRARRERRRRAVAEVHMVARRLARAVRIAAVDRIRHRAARERHRIARHIAGVCRVRNRAAVDIRDRACARPRERHRVPHGVACCSCGLRTIRCGNRPCHALDRQLVALSLVTECGVAAERIARRCRRIGDATVLEAVDLVEHLGRRIRARVRAQPRLIDTAVRIVACDVVAELQRIVRAAHQGIGILPLHRRRIHRRCDP